MQVQRLTWVLVALATAIAGCAPVGTIRRDVPTRHSEPAPEEAPRTGSQPEASGRPAQPAKRIEKRGRAFPTKRKARPGATRGMASYYGKQFHGKRTASGEIFDMYALTAAHRTLAFNTRVKVLNLSNNHFVIVRINDRIGNDKRIIDLSFEAARILDMLSAGLVEVELEVID